MKKLIYLLLLLPFFSFAQSGNFIEFKQQCSDKKERPFVVYTPQNQSNQAARPLLVYLHGAISSPTLKENPLEYAQKSQLIALADEGNFYILFPFGQKGATWFDAVGTDMLMSEIKTTLEKFNINKDKVFLSGFSDGGSGVFYLSMTKPMPFAGFIAMNGSLKVAEQLGELDIFPGNTNNKPFYIINTKGDFLYPLNQITPTIEYLERFNQNISFKTPEGNHEMNYLKDEQTHLIAFINKHSNANNKIVSWETSTPINNPESWVSIKEIDSTMSAKDWHQPYQLRVLNKKPFWGLKYDYSYQGKGLKIKSFKNDTCTAKRLGAEIGDIILMMEQDSMTSPFSEFYYNTKKTAGEQTSLTVLRNGEEKLLEGKFNDAYYYRIFNSDIKSGKIIAEIKGKNLFIKASRVKSIRLDTEKLRQYKVKKVIINDKKYKLQEIITLNVSTKYSK